MFRIVFFYHLSNILIKDFFPLAIHLSLLDLGMKSQSWNLPFGRTAHIQMPFFVGTWHSTRGPAARADWRIAIPLDDNFWGFDICFHTALGNPPTKLYELFAKMELYWNILFRHKLNVGRWCVGWCVCVCVAWWLRYWDVGNSELVTALAGSVQRFSSQITLNQAKHRLKPGSLIPVP